MLCASFVIFCLHGFAYVTALTVKDLRAGRSYNVHINESLEVHFRVHPHVTSMSLNHNKRGSIANGLQRLYKDFSLSQTNDSIVMNISNIQMLHNGTYTFRDIENDTVWDHFNIMVLIEPNQPRIVTPQPHAKEGEYFEMVCEAAGGNPPPIFKWYHRGKSMLGRTDVSIKTEPNYSTVILRNASADDDNTNFTCVVSNDALQSDLKVTSSISVHFIPRIEILLNDTKSIRNNSVVPLVSGQSLTLTAKTRSNPRVNKVLWIRPSSAQLDSRLLEIQSLNESGDYKLIVSNDAGNSTALFAISLLRVPDVNVSSTNITLDRGDKLELTCDVHSDPAPFRIYWTRNGVNISRALGTDNVSNHLLDTVTSSSLRINPVSRVDNGVYSCVAVNRITQFGSIPYYAMGRADVHVTVRYPPAIAMVNQKISGEVGEVVKLQCNAIGVPLPTVDWVRDDHTIPCTSSNSSGDFITCVLTISTVMPTSFGQYTCRARNIMATETMEFILTTKRVPEMPINVTAVSAGYSWVKLCWTPGYDGGASQSFVIESCTEIPILTKHTCANITGIIDAENCLVRLRARNAIGASQWTKRNDFALMRFPFESKEMPFLRNANFVDRYLHFELSPSRITLSPNEMCLQVYFSRKHDDALISVLFDKFDPCLVLEGNDSASFVQFFAKRSSDISELRIRVCAKDRQSVCGPEIAMDVTGFPVGSRIKTIVTAAVIASSVLLSVILTLLCMCKRRRTSKSRIKESKKKTTRKAVRFDQTKPENSESPVNQRENHFQLNKYVKANEFDEFGDYNSDQKTGLIVSSAHPHSNYAYTVSDLVVNTTFPSYTSFLPESPITANRLNSYSSSGMDPSIFSSPGVSSYTTDVKSTTRSPSSIISPLFSGDYISIDDESGYSTPTSSHDRQTGSLMDEGVVIYEATV